MQVFGTRVTCPGRWARETARGRVIRSARFFRSIPRSALPRDAAICRGPEPRPAQVDLVLIKSASLACLDSMGRAFRRSRPFITTPPGGAQCKWTPIVSVRCTGAHKSALISKYIEHYIVCVRVRASSASAPIMQHNGTGRERRASSSLTERPRKRRSRRCRRDCFIRRFFRAAGRRRLIGRVKSGAKGAGRAA